MIPFSGVTAMALSGTMTTVLAAVAIGTISGKLVWLYCMILHLLLDCRNDEDGVHWLPETILHVSKVTDDQVEHIKSAVKSCFDFDLRTTI